MKTPQRTVTTGTNAPHEAVPSTEAVDYMRYEFSKGYMPLENPKSIEPDHMDIK